MLNEAGEVKAREQKDNAPPTSVFQGLGVMT